MSLADTLRDGPRGGKFRHPAWAALPLLCWAAVIGGCGRTAESDRTPTVRVDFSRRIGASPDLSASASEPRLDIAVAGMMSPRQTLSYYQELLDYLGRTLNLPVAMKQRKTYQEVNDLLLNGELHAAFLCSGGYVQAGKALESEIVAAPVIRGKSTYQAYVIVRRSSPIYSFEDLRDHSFAFTDPLSNTGWLYPVSRLYALDATPSSFFSRVSYTYSHDRSIEAVARGLADGASVDGLVYDYIAQTSPDEVEDLRVVERSPEFGIPPVVASPMLDRELKEKLKVALLTMHDNANGKRILRKLEIDRFVGADARAYESIRTMARDVGPWRP